MKIYWLRYPLSLIAFALHGSSVIGESESLQGPVLLSPTTSGSRSNLQNGGSTATPMPTDEASVILHGLPKLTLHCSSLDSLMATVDWRVANTDLTPVDIEVACLDMDNITRTYWARQYLNAERLINDTVNLSSNSNPPTLHVTPTTTNKCTAAVWNVELPSELGGMTKIIGPYFTTCDLHSSDIISRPSVILDTIWSSVVTVDELANTLLTTSSSDPTDSMSSTPLVASTGPGSTDTSSVTLQATISAVLIALLLLAFSLVTIISIVFILKRRRKQTGRRSLNKEVFELDKLQHSQFLEDHECDEDTVIDDISENTFTCNVYDSCTSSETYSESLHVMGQNVTNIEAELSTPRNCRSTEECAVDHVHPIMTSITTIINPSESCDEQESDVLSPNDIELKQVMNESTNGRLDISSPVLQRESRTNIYVML